MEKPRYYRLTKGNRIVGFRRITNEYISMTGSWQDESLDYDDATLLTTPPIGIEVTGCNQEKKL